MDWQVNDHRVTITKCETKPTRYLVSDYETGEHIGIVRRDLVNGNWYYWTAESPDRLPMLGEATRREAVELLVVNHDAGTRQGAST